jgi:glutamyl-tRNA synthetase
VQKHLRGAEVADLVRRVADAREGLEAFGNPEAVEAAVREAGEAAGATGGKLIHPVRVAVTGRTVGPGLFETLSAVGKVRCVERLRRAAEMARSGGEG